MSISNVDLTMPQRPPPGRLLRRRQSASCAMRLATASLASALVALLVWVSLTPLNPDWLSYQVIFESEGAWLATQGRDPVFLQLINLAQNSFASYDSFREALGLYFIGFIFFFCSSNPLRMPRSKAVLLGMALALTSLAFTRFTIQIREGIAITFILIGMATLASKPTRHKTVRPFLAALWMLLAALTHAGTAIFLVASSLSLFVARNDKYQHQLTQIVKTILTAGGLLLIGALMTSPFQEIVLSGSGDRSLDAPVSTAGQWIYWLLYGVLCWWIHANMSRLIQATEYRGHLAVMLELLSGPFTALIIFCIYALLLTHAPTLILVSFARLLHLLLGINLVLVAAKTKNFVPVFIAVVFLVADQIRATAEAILIYSGVELF